LKFLLKPDLYLVSRESYLVKMVSQLASLPVTRLKN